VGSDIPAGSRVVCGSGGASFAEFASLCPGRRVLAGRRVEALALVVAGVAGDEPGVVPDLDGFGGHSQAAGHLGQGEHAGVTESLLAAAQPVFVADVADDEAVERAAFAAGQAAVVEDAGDLGVGVVIEELIDGGDDGGGGLAELRGVRRGGQGEGVVLAGGQADVRGDGVAGPGDGDVGEQQPGEPPALPWTVIPLVSLVPGGTRWVQRDGSSRSSTRRMRFSFIRIQA
jgi:hypothetical protein